MDQNKNAQDTAINAPEENAFLGALGALLFALIGGVVWVLLSRVNFIAGISGFIAVFCALKGYALFAKKESRKGLVISIVAAVVVLVAAWYISLAWDAYDVFKEEYDVSFLYWVQNAYLFLGDGEIGPAYFRDLIFGLIFCAVASIGYIINYNKKLKAASSGEVPPAPIISVVRTDNAASQVTDGQPADDGQSPDDVQAPDDGQEPDGGQGPDTED
ncbi:MAG: hypothetical protein IJU52_03065 [Clostridia bacterium]|nr:hypothetical protein [Clostridia bacterium]